MKKIISVVLTVTMLFSVVSVSFGAFAAGETDYTIVNPYETVDWNQWNFYKANLHTHSVASDADNTITDIVSEYYNQDYDILALTDHGVINNGWNKSRETNGVFNYFRDCPSMSDEDYLRITNGTDRNGRGMLDITGGIEVNMAVLSKTHVNGFFTTYGQGEWGVENDYRTAVAEIDKAGGYSHLNHIGDWMQSNAHPERAHWDSYIQYFANILVDYPSCLGMEIVNSKDSVTKADRALWDELLQVVIPHGRNIWAFANDDSHALDEVGRSFEYFLMPENTVESFKTAMENGTFFACSRFHKRTDGAADTEGNGNVPLVKEIIVDEEENTLEIVLDETRDCDLVEWIANGEVISNNLKIDLNDYEEKLGCYVRFQLKGEGGITYSQAFELQYENRQDKEIPERSPLFETQGGDLFLQFYHTLVFAILEFLGEKTYDLISDLF